MPPPKQHHPDLFTGLGITTLHEVFSNAGVMVVHEHRALKVALNFERDKALYMELGYDVELEVPGIAISMTRGNDRIELVPKNVPAHEAWIVRTQTQYTALLHTFQNDGRFRANGHKFHLDNLWANMFELLEFPGCIVEIVWRQEPIYLGLFDSLPQGAKTAPAGNAARAEAEMLHCPD